MQLNETTQAFMHIERPAVVGTEDTRVALTGMANSNRYMIVSGPGTALLSPRVYGAFSLASYSIGARSYNVGNFRSDGQRLFVRANGKIVEGAAK